MNKKKFSKKWIVETWLLNDDIILNVITIPILRIWIKNYREDGSKRKLLPIDPWLLDIAFNFNKNKKIKLIIIKKEK